MPFLSTKYTRTTHYSECVSRYLTQKQCELWREVWPVGCAVPVGSYKTFDEIKVRVEYLCRLYKLKTLYHPTKLEEVLAALVEAKLISSELFGGRE